MTDTEFTLTNVKALQLMTTKNDLSSGVCITPISGGGMSVAGDVDITGGLSVSTMKIGPGSITDTSGQISYGSTSFFATTGNIITTSGNLVAGSTNITGGSITDSTNLIDFGGTSISSTRGASISGGVTLNGYTYPPATTIGTSQFLYSKDGSGISGIGLTGGSGITLTYGENDITITSSGGGGGGGGVTNLGGLSDAYVVESEYNAILGTSPAGITGNFNTGVGISTLYSVTSGANNTAMGAEAASSLITGRKNTAIGSSALVTDAGGNETTAIGFQALHDQFFIPDSDTDTFNTAVGSRAGYQLTTGTSCTFIGASSGGGVITGTNLTCLGFGSQPSTLSATNEVTLGNPNITSLRCADTTIASLSDARDKNDIRDSTYGLNFLENVRPVEFTWDRRVLTPDDENDPKQGKRRVGFIAQELLEASGEDGNQILDLVYTANPQRLEAKYGNLIPVMVKAIQDLKTEVDTIKEHLNLE